MHRREVRLAFSMFLGLGLAGSVVGCEEEFSDEQFGILDLAPVYDGGTPSNPAAGIPSRSRPAGLPGRPAWPSTTTSASVPTHHQPRRRHAHRGARAADVLLLRPSGRGRCSRARCASCATAPTGSRAGRTCSTPTPRTSAPAARPTGRPCQARNDKEKMKSYPLRQRDPLVRSRPRRSDDYQRPLDRSHPAGRRPAPARVHRAVGDRRGHGARRLRARLDQVTWPRWTRRSPSGKFSKRGRRARSSTAR